MRVVTLTRRQFLTAAGMSAAMRCRPLQAQSIKAGGASTDKAQAESPAVRGLLRLSDSLWCFDPVGLHVKTGETVRFLNASIQMITLTAYHPDNDNHELRIPEAARAFDLDLGRERVFQDWTFDVEGTYDYFSRYQELLGMIGRIVVGRPGGPGEKRWGYGGRDGRNPIYEAVHKTAKLLDSQEIAAKRVIPFPFDAMSPGYPLWD